VATENPAKLATRKLKSPTESLATVTECRDTAHNALRCRKMPQTIPSQEGRVCPAQGDLAQPAFTALQPAARSATCPGSQPQPSAEQAKPVIRPHHRRYPNSTNREGTVEDNFGFVQGKDNILSLLRHLQLVHLRQSASHPYTRTPTVKRMMASLPKRLRKWPHYRIILIKTTNCMIFDDLSQSRLL
jgi:hypothetical protein